MSLNRVAIAGATGNLGPSIVEALVNNGFHVFAFSRSGNTAALPSVVKTIKADYQSPESLVSSLRTNKIDVLISNLHDANDQIRLIDAAIEAGVKRVLPGEFGADVFGNAKCRELPVFKNGKLRVQQYLREQGDRIDWTVVVTSVFFDWALQKSTLIINPNVGGVTQLWDDPERKFSATLRADVGQAVVGVLQHPDETKNRAVYVHSASISQNEILAAAKKAKPGQEFKTERVSSKEVLEKSLADMKEGENVGSALKAQIKISILDEDCGADFGGHDDNELLQVRMLSAKEVEEVVKQYIL